MNYTHNKILKISQFDLSRVFIPINNRHHFEITNREKALSHFEVVKKDNPTLFNGTVILTEYHQTNPLQFRVYPLSYASYMYFYHNKILQLNQGILGFKLIIQFEEFFLVGKRSTSVTHHKNTWSSIGGTFEWNDGKIEITESIFRETKEEVGLDIRHLPLSITHLWIEGGNSINVIASVRLDNSTYQHQIRANYEWKENPKWISREKVMSLFPKTLDLDLIDTLN